MSNPFESFVFNPNNLPEYDLPTIFGFSDGGSGNWWFGVLLAEDGTLMGQHLCSHEGYMPGDLGIIPGTRPDRHEQFRIKYPNGYRMEFVHSITQFSHEKLNETKQKAFALIAKEKQNEE